jgi:23S rRNA (uracil1939-C5)-methyltransferase
MTKNSQPNPKPHQQIELDITRIGHMADGVGVHEGKQVFVPFTCPGDTIKALITRESKDGMRADMLKLITPSSQRQTPACKHFGTCGGCSLQHLDTASYQAFKQDMLGAFMRGIGVDEAVIAPMIIIKEGTRRRADFKMQVDNGIIRIGFFAAKSHKLIDIEECPISDAHLTAILPALKACLAELKKPGRLTSISLTALDNGLDATIKLSAAIGVQDQEKLIQFAQTNNIIRLHTQVKPRHISRKQPRAQEPVCLYDEGNASINFAGVNVALPAGAFLQASQEGQMAITQLVLQHLKGASVIADLYSGCGTYSFALIKQAERICAYEGADEMAAAMNNACVTAGFDARIATTVRDLFKHPLTTDELDYFDGVVINPPRNGALPQIENIALSNVGKVVMVSCDPATFKRDAKQLIDAGYRLTLAVPIDQFYWSRHLELVAVFEK